MSSTGEQKAAGAKSFPAYSEYKDSGVEWLGDVPAHWAMKRLRYVAELNPSKSEVRTLPDESSVSFIPMEAVGEDGSLFLEQTRPINEVLAGYTYVREGDVTVAKITPCFENGKGAVMRGLESRVGFGSTEFTVLRPKTGLTTSDYLYRIVSSEPFRVLGESSMYGAGGQKRVPDDFVRNFTIAWPPYAEQLEIEAFLDHETARIDALIAEQQRLIALLKEKRQAVISHAVMGHGDGRKGKLGHYVDLLPGYAFPSSGFHQEGVRLLRGANIGVGEVDWNETVYWPEDKTDGLDDYKLRVGDLVFGMDRPWIKKGGRVSFVGEKDLPAYVLQRVARLRAKKGLEQYFLRLVLVSKEFRDYVEVDMTGVSVPHVSPEQICALKISLPRQNKQIEICREVSMGLSRLASLIATAESSISLMQERRSALISAAVTGKIDVRGWQASASSSASAETVYMEGV